MLYIIDSGTDPYRNLAAEEHLFKDFDRPVFRLWRNDRAVIVGRYQNAAAEVNREFVRENGIAVVRRLTGGGAVFHDLGNVNFTFIDNRHSDEDTSAMFRRFTAPILDALRNLGVNAALEGRNDLTIGGKKFSGNAIAVSGGRILQHGTLLFSSKFDDMTGALRVRSEKYSDKAVKSIPARVTNISDHLPHPMTVEEFIEYLGDFIAGGNPHYAHTGDNLCHEHDGNTHLYEHDGAHENASDSMASIAGGNPHYAHTGGNPRYEYTDEDNLAIDALVRTRYGTDAWNYGQSPHYSVSNVRKFPAGLCETYYDVSDGRIRNLHVYGDYFFTLPTEEFCSSVEGCAASEEALRTRLSTLPCDSYFKGVSPAQLLSLLLP